MNIHQKYPNRWRFYYHYPRNVTVDELGRFENKHQLNLPSEFKTFYSYYNGCLFFYEFHNINMFLNKKNKIINTYIKISCFYPLEKINPFTYPGDQKNEQHQTQNSLKDTDREKRQLYLWFGEAASGHLLIGIQPENFGKIYYWDGIEEEEYNPFWMSDSLVQFIEDCRVFTENPYKDLRP